MSGLINCSWSFLDSPRNIEIYEHMRKSMESLEIPKFRTCNKKIFGHKCVRDSALMHSIDACNLEVCFG